MRCASGIRSVQKEGGWHHRATKWDNRTLNSRKRWWEQINVHIPCGTILFCTGVLQVIVKLWFAAAAAAAVLLPLPLPLLLWLMLFVLLLFLLLCCCCCDFGMGDGAGERGPP